MAEQTYDLHDCRGACLPRLEWQRDDHLWCALFPSFFARADDRLRGHRSLVDGLFDRGDQRHRHLARAAERVKRKRET